MKYVGLPSAGSRAYGTLPNGDAVAAWTLRSAGGLTAEILAYGATVSRLLVPSSSGELLDVVLGHSSLEAYLQATAYMGATVGRVAGRMTPTTFTLDGHSYTLTANEGITHLHGGLRGFDKQLWQATNSTCTAGDASLTLRYLSPEGDEGYPGNLAVHVTYTVTVTNALVIETRAACDRATPFSPTHHSYFNLTGDGTKDVLDHTLQIFAESYVPVDGHFRLLNRVEPVEAASNDLRHPRQLREITAAVFCGHGDLYRLQKPTGSTGREEPAPAATLCSSLTGLQMEVLTTESYLQLYTASHFDGRLPDKNENFYPKFSGVCFECQGYPNGASSGGIESNILPAGVLDRRKTIYAFSSLSTP